MQQIPTGEASGGWGFIKVTMKYELRTAEKKRVEKRRFGAEWCRMGVDFIKDKDKGQNRRRKNKGGGSLPLPPCLSAFSKGVVGISPSWCSSLERARLIMVGGLETRAS